MALSLISIPLGGRGVPSLYKPYRMIRLSRIQRVGWKTYKEGFAPPMAGGALVLQVPVHSGKAGDANRTVDAATLIALDEDFSAVSAQRTPLYTRQNPGSQGRGER